jgi:hypothetical protein
MKELENLIIEKIPHYFNGKGANKTFGFYFYNEYCFIGTFMKKEIGSYPIDSIIGSFVIPNFLLIDAKKEGVNPNNIIRRSVSFVLDEKKIKINQVRRLENSAKIGDVDYAIFYFGIIHNILEKETNFLENTIKEIRDLCLRNLNTENLNRYLYI